MLGAYIFETGVTAYAGAAPFFADKTILAGAAGILAVEAYHDGLVRSLLFAEQKPHVTGATAQISNISGRATEFERRPGRTTVVEHMNGHVVAAGLLIGTYERP